VLIQHWVPKPIPKDGIYTVYRILPDKDFVWASLTPSGGLWRQDRATKVWQKVHYRVGTPATHVLSLAMVNDRLYVGTLGAGPWYYEPGHKYWQSLNLLMLKEGRPYAYLGDRSAIRWDNIYSIVPQGSLVWMATNHGLICHDPEKTPSGFKIIGPIARISRGIAVAGDSVWLGTLGGGLSRIRTDTLLQPVNDKLP